MTLGVTALLYILGAVLVISRFQLSNHVPVYQHIFRTLHALFFAFIILDQSFNKRDILKWLPTWFSYLGQISYGLYLLHPIALFLIYLFLPASLRIFWIQFPLVVVLTIVLSALSYHFFESNFLRLKQKF
jgi:peptidoglycan/LPS O-acetylase OafA/YrhL